MKNLPNSFYWIVSVGIILAAVFIKGCSSKEVIIDQVSSEYRVWWEADFSETTTSLDMDGDLVTDTDYLEETVSDVHYVHAIDGVIVETNSRHLNGLECRHPNKDSRARIASQDIDFDKFDLETRHSYKASVEGEEYRVNLEEHQLFLRGCRTAKAKTFFGNIAYIKITPETDNID